MPLVASSESRIIKRRAATASSWWLSGGISVANCLAAYGPKGAASLAASYANLANPGTYDAAPGTAPTWDATNGWKFAGASSQYLTTGILPQAGYSTFVRFSDYSYDSSGHVIFGGQKDANTRYYIYPRRDATNNYRQYAYGNDLRSTSAGTGATSGVIGLAGPNMYYNGALDNSAGTFTGTGVAIYIAAYNNNPTALLFATVYIQAMAIYSVTITLAQVIAITDAMNAL